MLELYVTLQTLGVGLSRMLHNRLAVDDDDERGAHIIEYLIVAVGVIGLATLVVVALRAFVNSHTSQISGAK